MRREGSQNLLALAANVCPDAIPPIEKALASLGRRFRLKLALLFQTANLDAAGGNHGTSVTAHLARCNRLPCVPILSPVTGHRSDPFVSLRK
jgi:hypothetical protein